MANAFAFEFIEPIWVAQHQINGPHAAIVLARVNDPLVVIDLLVLQSSTVLPLILRFLALFHTICHDIAQRNAGESMLGLEHNGCGTGKFRY